MSFETIIDLSEFNSEVGASQVLSILVDKLCTKIFVQSTDKGGLYPFVVKSSFPDILLEDAIVCNKTLVVLS